MAIRFPDIPERLGLGVGLDLHWGDAIGFGRAALGAALLLGRPSRRKDPAAPSLDAT